MGSQAGRAAMFMDLKRCREPHEPCELQQSMNQRLALGLESLRDGASRRTL
jgi:hypothetical protein